MSKTFEECIKQGGKVRTRSLSKDRYQMVCIFKGRVYPGIIYKKQKSKRVINDKV